MWFAADKPAPVSGHRSPGLYGAALLAVLMAGLQALPGPWRDALRYQRIEIGDGEVWRLLTANVVHLGWSHLALNAAALLIMGGLFGAARSAGGWAGDFLICAVGCSAGLYFFSPDIFWVVGLSGALHGLFVIGALSWAWHGDRAGWVLLAGLAVKLIYEQTQGEIPLSAEVVGGAVVIDAHLWGAAAGVLAFLVQMAVRHART